MKSSRIAIITVLLTISSIGTAFYDDFNDGDISDWEPRCAPGNWQATSGMVYGSTGGTPAAFVPVVYEKVDISSLTANGSVDLHAADFQSGIYFYTLTVKGQTLSRRRMIVVQ